MPEKPHHVRIEAETWRALEALAKKNRRSVAAEIMERLDFTIDVEDGWPEPEECRHCGKARAEHVQVVVGGRDDACQRDVLPTQERTFWEA